MIAGIGLVRVFGSIRAVGGVDLAVGPGEVLGLLGPNGAGKTTTLRMLAGLLRPTEGRALIDGHDAQTDSRAAHASLGFVSGTAALFPRLTPREFLTYMGHLHGLPRESLAARVDAAIDRFEIAPFARLRCGALSTGQRQRVALARASLHEPAALILDEPSAGLDVLGAQAVISFVRAAAADRKAVLLSTHDMAEAELLCHRIAILAGGRIVATGTAEELKAASGRDKLAEVFLHYVGGPTERKTA